MPEQSCPGTDSCPVPDEERIVPYTVWDNATKVTLRVKSVVKLHGRTYTDRPTSTAQSSWVEYNFQDEQGEALVSRRNINSDNLPAAGTFQTALMGKTLLMTIPTNKTIRVTGGLKGSLSMQEQMCALENLRIWREHDTQGVLAMIHFTPHYRDGYLIFYRPYPSSPWPTQKRTDLRRHSKHSQRPSPGLRQGQSSRQDQERQRRRRPRGRSGKTCKPH